MGIILFLVGLLASLTQVNWPSDMLFQPQLVIIFILLLTLRLRLSSLVWYCLVYGVVLDINSPWNLGISTPFLILICLIASFGLRIVSNPNQGLSLLGLVLLSSLGYQLLTVVYASNISLIGGVNYWQILLNLALDLTLTATIIFFRSLWISNQNHRRWSWER
ncbi:rod shape-determining protein MreD [Candidatus Saccharibacteria bacterium]|nr:rod shape-determining protein MreD [Candidatus Saccharibacteria bacterium]MCB9834824.1 rod shape-determining protein MreD [Candidatus Nomurabacteria bacterium]